VERRLSGRRNAVEVVLALEDRQIVVPLRVEPGATVGEAIALANLPAQAAGLDLDQAPVGIFGRPCARETPLSDGDRVEIYRPLRADPKDRRRQRAASAGKAGRSLRGSAASRR
jgi:putative ubiquitin-RnfH superfamily antitoxin RatB of RatAB toxin-antitoxin module